MGGGERARWAMKRAVSPVSKRVFQAASAAKEDDYCELSCREVSAGAKRKTILRIVFRRERADIRGSPEFRYLSPEAT